MTVAVVLTESAAKQIQALPATIKARIADVVVRLREYPAVSGVKHLRGDLRGESRVRTGDYRIIFTVSGSTLTITKVAHRRDVYED